MLYAHSGVQTKLPDKTVEDGFVWLEAAGYTKSIGPGCIALLPLGLRALRTIESAIRRSATPFSFNEVNLPLLQKKELWEESGRATQYSGILCETTIGAGQTYVINPTQEEAVLDLLRRTDLTKRDYPIRLFQISERIRNEVRPAFGLIRSRCFVLCDLYAVSLGPDEAREESQRLESLMRSFLDWTGLPYEKGTYLVTNSGAPVYSFWVPSATKQCMIARCSACGYSYRYRDTVPERCPHCGSDPLTVIATVEVCDLMESSGMIAHRLNVHPAGDQTPVHVVMSGIGVSRTLQLMAEYYHDERGLCWPFKAAPLPVHLIAAQDRHEEALRLTAVLTEKGFEPLLDLREMRIGRRLIDADIIGLPVRVVLGEKTPSSQYDVTVRSTKQSVICDIDQLLQLLASQA